MKPYRPPLVYHTINIIGLLTALAATVFAVQQSPLAAIASGVNAFLCAGLAAAINFAAKAAHFAEQLAGQSIGGSVKHPTTHFHGMP